MTGTVLVRRPGPRLADGIVTHIDRTPVDVGLARSQHEAYVAALAAHGWRPVEVGPADDCPDAVFVEDTVVVAGRRAVVTRPGAVERRPETAAVEAVVRSLELHMTHVSAPGTLDGGDVLCIGETLYVGVGGRTNDDGARQLGAALERVVVPVPLRRVLHLKSAVTALPDGTVLGHDGLVDARALPPVLAVPEESGAHVVLLGERTVLMAASAPRTADLLAARGLDPVLVDISEFERLEGCVTCLSVLIPA